MNPITVKLSRLGPIPKTTAELATVAILAALAIPVVKMQGVRVLEKDPPVPTTDLLFSFMSVLGAAHYAIALVSVMVDFSMVLRSGSALVGARMRRSVALVTAVLGVVLILAPTNARHVSARLF